jgi:hypothetical protein
MCGSQSWLQAAFQAAVSDFGAVLWRTIRRDLRVYL